MPASFTRNPAPTMPIGITPVATMSRTAFTLPRKASGTLRWM